MKVREALWAQQTHDVTTTKSNVSIGRWFVASPKDYATTMWQRHQKVVL